jgi:pilus assembly protein CpaC
VFGVSVAGQSAGSNSAESPNDLSIAVGKSAVVTSDRVVQRVSVGFGDVAEAIAAGPREVLVSGKAPGSTSLIIWQEGGGKLFFDVNVRPNQFLANTRLESVRRELGKELPGQQITVSFENDAIFLRGTAKDLTSMSRAIAVASTVARVVNLMYVNVPTQNPQVLLKVRFASLDRNLSTQLGLNIFSTGATNTIGAIGTGQYPGPTLPLAPNPNNATNPFVFSNLLNLFLFRPDLNLGATIQALQIKGVLQILAEPNVLAEDGKEASFLAGGEFPYPVFQGSAGGVGAVTIQFREFGVRLNFIPTITPRGTIHLQVAPEVSSLDFTNGLTIQGFNVPALTTRKMKTEVELGEGQSFAISGLLDRRVTDTFQKMPFIGDIPIIGKLFQSKNTNRQNTELLVIVTPELVRPQLAGAPPQELKFPTPFMESGPVSGVQQPGIAVTGPVPVTPPSKSIPAESLMQSLQPEQPLTGTSGSGVLPTNSNAASQVPASAAASVPTLVTPAMAAPH